MTVTPEVKEAYETHGWCLVRDLIKADVVEEARRHLDQLIASSADWPLEDMEVIAPEIATDDVGLPLPCLLYRAATHIDVFSEIVRSQQLIMAMESLLGGRVRLFRDEVQISHGDLPGGSGGSSYHQDVHLWHREPEVSCNCWIALDHLGPDAGAPAIRPGSHRGWKIANHEPCDDGPDYGQMHDGTFRPSKHHAIRADEVDDHEEVIPELHPGDGLFITNYTWHRRVPNSSGKTLCMYAIDYELNHQ